MDRTFKVHTEDAIDIVHESLEFLLRDVMHLAYMGDEEQIEERLHYISEQVIDQLENNSIDEEE